MPTQPIGIYAEQTAKRAAPALAAVYRPRDSAPWIDCEIVGYTPDGAMLREVGKVWPGVWLAPLDRIRIPTGLILEIEERGTYRRAA